MNEMWPLDGHRVEIPELVKDEETGKPFAHCRICELDLQSPPKPYMVEKVIRRNKELGLNEVLFGYAICLDCAGDMRSQISKESMLAIQQFISQRVDFQARIMEVFEQDFPDVDRHLSTCMITGNSIKEEGEYQIAALCEGDSLVLGLWPYVVSSTAIAELSGLLSNETLGHMDDFYGQNFGLPPEWADLFKEKPVFWL
ncbi:MAG: hypothetical protein NWR72_12045 [Bacteroidia bacterium]|nr:hypothetical protein [Bacteroidia bacterium]